MRRAIQLANHAKEQNEVPVGALLVKSGNIIAEGWNQSIQTQDPTAHAEIVAMRAAAVVLKNYRLVDTELYVTLEPCTMCVGAIIHARVSHVVYGASDPKTGALGGSYSVLDTAQHNHKPLITCGVLAEECGDLLTTFFRARRK